jgi:hypothetical protein
MLAEIVEARKLFGTMTGERALAGMLPNMPSQMFTPGINHATFAIASALEGFSRSWAITFGDTTI